MHRVGFTIPAYHYAGQGVLLPSFHLSPVPRRNAKGCPSALRFSGRSILYLQQNCRQNWRLYCLCGTYPYSAPMVKPALNGWRYQPPTSAHGVRRVFGLSSQYLVSKVPGDPAIYKEHNLLYTIYSKHARCDMLIYWPIDIAP